MKKYLLFLIILIGLFIAPKVHATTYYIDYATTTCGLQDGLATTSAYCSLISYMGVARSLGDIAIVKRGNSTTTVFNITIVTSGALANPIVVTADNKMNWSTDFASSSQTYNMVIGSSTIASNAAITDIVAGQWIFVNGDDPDKFSYEVKSVTSSTLSLYIPYKGLSSGSTVTLNRMSANPIWGSTANDRYISFSLYSNWRIQGLDIVGSGVTALIYDSASSNSFNRIEFVDDIFRGNGGTSYGIRTGATNNWADWMVRKSRFYNIKVNNAGGSKDVRITSYDNYYNLNNVATSWAIAAAGTQAGGHIISKNDIVVGMPAATGCAFYILGIDMAEISNLRVSIPSRTLCTATTYIKEYTYLEDLDIDPALNTENIGNNKTNRVNNVQPNVFEINSTSTVLRSGGGASSEQVIPLASSITTLSSFPHGIIKLFEYPIYTNTSNKQYTLYFMSTSTSAWTANPTASELWIECDYWNFPANASSSRYILKSTGTLSFTTLTTWQSLSVTCQPTNTGILYLRGWYAKTKETPMNEFFVDTTPVISTP